MSGRKIDFDKVDKAFQALSDTKEGQQLLGQISAAFDSLDAATGVELTNDERKWVLQNLIKQKETKGDGITPSATHKLGTRVIEGFRIHASVPV